MTEHDRRFREDIEGFRGLAVLLVVLYHVRIPGLGGGFVGVDMFFVLSGYLITGLLAEEYARRGTIDFPRFYFRRARRLLPASVLMLVVTVVAGWLTLAPLTQDTVARTAVATSVYLSNVWFLRNSADYFAASTELNPLLHTWSLAVEEQFYLFWPLVVFMTLRAAGSRHRALLLLGVATVASLAYSVHALATGSLDAFYGLVSRAWEFGVGALAAIRPGLRSLSSPLRSGVRVAGFAALGATALLFTDKTAFPGASALLPTIGSALVLIAGEGEPAPPGLGHLLRARWLRWLGETSYSFYLWHWPVLIIAESLSPGLSIPGRIAAAFLSLGIARAAFVLVERPLRGMPQLVQPPRRALAFVVGLTVLGMAGGVAWRVSAARAAGSAEQRGYRAALEDVAMRTEDGCIARFAEDRILECEFGADSAVAVIALFGDSHAGHWLPALLGPGSARWRVVTIVKAGCPVASISVANPRRGVRSEPCDEWRAGAIRRLEALRPSLIIAASSSEYVHRVGEINRHSSVSTAEFEAASRDAFAQLDRIGVPVLVLRDTPWPGFNVPLCLSNAAHRSWLSAKDCDFGTSEGLRSGAAEAESRAAAGLRNVRVADLALAVCPAIRCEVVRDGVIMFHDDGHLSRAGAAMLAPAMEQLVSRAFPSSEVRLRE